MKRVAAVDLGALSGRVVVAEFDGRRVGVSEVHRFRSRPVRTLGRLHWDVLGLYAQTLDGLSAARARGRIDSAGIDSWAVDFGLLDRRGALLQNPVCYRDARRAEAFPAALQRVPARELYERTGIQLMAINTLFELAAMAAENDPALAAAETLLLVPDLLHYWLSGIPSAEYTNATTTRCLDVRSGHWATDLLERLDVPSRVLPDVVQPGTRLGTLVPEVMEETGLAGTELVAVATHDTASAVAAIPFRRPGSAFVSAGTWSLVGLEVERPVINSAAYGANLTNEGGVEGTYRLLGNVTGLWLLEESRGTWSRQGHEYASEELVALAAGAPPLLSLVDPDDPRLAMPGDIPTRIRELCAETGQPAPREPGALVRCILESLALKHAHAVQLLRTAAGVEPEEVHLIGGGARNDLLCSFTASATGLPVLAGPEEATSIGNALVQLLALGEIRSIAEGRDLVRASFEPRVHEPADESRWSEALDRFAGLLGTRRPGEAVA